MRTVQSSQEIMSEELMGEVPILIANKGYGELQLKNFYYSQAVRIANRVDISGQGGYDHEFKFPKDVPLKEEIVRSLQNVENVLAASGASWKDVISMTSYHVDLTEDVAQFLGEQIRIRMPSHAPIWTCIGVARLVDPGMRVEIVVSAIIRD